MRIAVIVESFPVLSETFVLNQITGLIDRGHQVHVYAWRPPKGSVEHPDVARYGLANFTHYWPSRPKNWTLRLLKAVGLSALAGPWSWPDVIRSLRFRRFGDHSRSLSLAYKATVARRKKYDVLLCHFGKIGREIQMLREVGALDGRLVTVFHGYDMSRFLTEHGDNVYDELLERGDLFLPISDFWRNRLVDMGVDPDKTVVHRMGIDCGRFNFTARTPPESGPVRLVSVARLVEKKGVEYAIRAVARLIHDGVDLRYAIIGDGPSRPALERLIANLDVAERVSLEGWRDQAEVVTELNHAHVLIAPSVTAANGDMEGLPVALMEALALGLPVVTTRHSGIPELIEDGVNGFLVDERDVDGLVEKLSTLLSNPAEWAEFGRRGHEKVAKEFEIEGLNDTLVVLLEELCARGA